MNKRTICFIIGWILIIEGALMSLPILTSLIYRERAGWMFVLTALCCLAVGGLIVFLLRKDTIHFHIREGYITVALSWIVLSIMGAVPFVLTGAIPDFVDAVFETISGFTTTGASILSDVEVLPKCVLLWRSFTHWVGGMGVLVFLLSLLKLTGGTQMNLMKAESPGPSVSRLVPSVRSTAKILYTIYLFLTVLQMVILLICRMPLFDSICIAFGTAGTGGFAVTNSGLGGYSALCQWVVTVFMILFGVNFNAYFFVTRKKFRQAAEMEEVRWYFLIILATVLIITFNIRGLYDGIATSLRHAAFQVGSIITTTGFGTTDFDLWPETSKTILVLLMFCGACAGSTGGGIKVSRFIILLKAFFKELLQYLHPRQVRKIRMDGKMIEHETLRNVNVYMTAYALIFVVSLMILTIENKDLITNFTAVAATFNNIGPGLALVGPTRNFAHYSHLSKIVLSFCMLAGRLEIFPLLLMFVPDTWKKF